MPAASEAAGSPGGTGLPSTITRPDALRPPEAPNTARASSPRPDPARPVTPSTSPGASEKLIALSRPGTVRFSTVIKRLLAVAGRRLAAPGRLDVAADHGVHHLGQGHVGDRAVAPPPDRRASR